MGEFYSFWLYFDADIALRQNSEVSEIHHIFDSVLHIAAVLLNLLLFYHILRNSTFQVAAYKYLLLLTCCSDLSISVVVLVGQPVKMNCRISSTDS